MNIQHQAGFDSIVAFGADDPWFFLSESMLEARAQTRICTLLSGVVFLAVGYASIVLFG